MAALLRVSRWFWWVCWLPCACTFDTAATGSPLTTNPPAATSGRGSSHWDGPRAGSSAIDAGIGAAAGSGGTAGAGAGQGGRAAPSGRGSAGMSGTSAGDGGMSGATAGTTSTTCRADLDRDNDGLMDCVDPAPLGWKKRLTIDGAQVSAALSDFPLLVRIRDTQLAAAAKRDGSDIRFIASDETTPLQFELERYDGMTGELAAWVRLPMLNASTDTTLFIRYGEGQMNRSDAAAVWSGYRYVWHLSQDPGLVGMGTLRDSTRAADATPEGNMTTLNRIRAVAGDGLAFDGQDDRLTFRNSFSGTGPSTIGAWVRQLPDSGDSGAAVITFGSEASNQARFLLSLDAATALTGAGFYSNDVSGTALAQSQWCHLVWTWDGTNSSIFVNGNLASGPIAHAGANTAGEAGAIGGSVFMYPRFLSGELDEVRVATRALSIEWIATEYRNQRPDSTFIRTIDPEVPLVSP